MLYCFHFPSFASAALLGVEKQLIAICGKLCICEGNLSVNPLTRMMQLYWNAPTHDLQLWVENPPLLRDHLIGAHNEDADKAELTSLPTERWRCGRPSLVLLSNDTSQRSHWPQPWRICMMHQQSIYSRGAWIVCCLIGLFFWEGQQVAGWLDQACFTLISPLIRGDVSPSLIGPFFSWSITSQTKQSTNKLAHRKMLACRTTLQKSAAILFPLSCFVTCFFFCSSVTHICCWTSGLTSSTLRTTSRAWVRLYIAQFFSPISSQQWLKVLDWGLAHA